MIPPETVLTLWKSGTRNLLDLLIIAHLRTLPPGPHTKKDIRASLQKHAINIHPQTLRTALDRLQDLKLLTITQARLSTQSIQYALPPVARASCPEPSSPPNLPIPNPKSPFP